MAVGGRTLLRPLIVFAVGVLLAPSGAWAAGPTTAPTPTASLPPASSPAPHGTPESLRPSGGARAASAETSPCGTPVGPGPIILPRDGTIYAAITEVDAAVDSDWGLDQPEHRQLVANIREPAQWGPDLVVGTFAAGTALAFYTHTPY